MSETKPKSVGMPGTEESTNTKFMQAGLHLVKVKEIFEAVDKDGKKMLDKTGNPAVKVVFVNKAEEEIEGIYFYSPLAFDDPKRKLEEFKCKSEFRLHQLKTAMGFGMKPIPQDAAKKAKLWLVVKLQETVDAQGNPVMNEKTGKQKTWHTVGDAIAIAKDENEKLIRPMLKGDPQTDPENFRTGVFFETKVDKTVSAATAMEHEEPAPQTSLPGETPANPAAGEKPAGGSEDW